MPNRDIRKLRGSRRSRPLPFAPLVALAVLAMGIAYAQQNLPAPVPSAATDPRSGDAESGTAPPPADDAPIAAAPKAADGTAPQPSPSPSTGKGSPQRFEPTEKVRPDFDVAFPIDI
jgi:hypothetical protein